MTQPGGVRLFDLHGLEVKMWSDAVNESCGGATPPRLGWLPSSLEAWSCASKLGPIPVDVYPVTPLMVTWGGAVEKLCAGISEEFGSLARRRSVPPRSTRPRASSWRPSPRLWKRSQFANSLKKPRKNRWI